MNRRLVLIALTGALVVVVGLAVWFTLKPPGKAGQAAASDEADKVEISKAELNDIKEMDVDSPRGKLRLFKVGDNWKADTSYPVTLDKSSVEDLEYSFARLYSEKVIEKDPKDLKIYGLDPPVAIARAYLKDGSTIELHLGNQTPAGNTYYLQKKGDPTVYAVWMNHGEHFQWVVNDLRDKKLAAIDPQKLKAVKIVRKGQPTIDIVSKDEQDDSEVVFSMGLYRMIQPYSRPYATDTQAMSDWLQKMPTFAIDKFVEDNVKDWARYGLASPSAELFMQDDKNTLHLYFGDRTRDGKDVYFRVAGQDSAYAMSADRLDFLDIKPFKLVDKFAFIVNIDNVDKVRVQGPGLDMTLSMTRATKKVKNDEGKETDEVVTTYFAQGKEVKEDPFKKVYQSLIGLFIEGENKAPKHLAPEVTMTYTLNKGRQRVHTIEYTPHDVDFYEVYVDGKTEFLMSRQQIANMLADCKKFLAENVKE
jgi:hypothetical protein